MTEGQWQRVAAPSDCSLSPPSRQNRLGSTPSYWATRRVDISCSCLCSLIPQSVSQNAGSGQVCFILLVSQKKCLWERHAAFSLNQFFLSVCLQLLPIVTALDHYHTIYLLQKSLKPRFPFLLQVNSNRFEFKGHCEVPNHFACRHFGLEFGRSKVFFIGGPHGSSSTVFKLFPKKRNL